MAFAPGEDPGPGGQHSLQMILDLGHRLVLDQRADLDAVLEGRTDGNPGHRFRQLGRIGLGDRGMDVDAVGTDAGLARVPELALDGLGDREIEIRVLEHHKGSRPPQFHRQPLQRRGALFGQLSAHGRRAGKAELADEGRGRQHAADRRRLAGDHAERALRQARLIGQFDQGDGGEGRLAGRLDHGGAARGERRSQLPRQHGGGEVPGRDQGAGANRLAEGDDHVAQRTVLGVAQQALGFAGEPFQEAVGIDRLAARLLERLAVFQRHQAAEAVQILVDQPGPVAQERRPPVRVGARPVGKGVVGGLDGAPGLGDAQVGHMADDLARRRIVDGDAPVAGHHLAGDQGVLAQELEAGVAGGGVHGRAPKSLSLPFMGRDGAAKRSGARVGMCRPRARYTQPHPRSAAPRGPSP